MITQYRSLDATLHQAASELDYRIDCMDNHLLDASQSPTVERLKQCADSVHRKHEQLRKALEFQDTQQMTLVFIHLLKEIERFYQILGA